MSPERRSAPAGGAGATSDLLGSGIDTKHTDLDLEMATIGRLLMSEPADLAERLGPLTPEDFADGACQRACAIITEFVNHEIPEDIPAAFAERASAKEPGLAARFTPSPGLWTANAMSKVADYGPGLAFAASRLVGRGLIRTAEDAARRIQRACALADTSDVPELREIIAQELPKLTSAVERPPGAADAIPPPTTLTKFLEQHDDPLRYRIRDVLTVGGRGVLAAQFKAGKTSLVDNCMRSFADGDPFLDQFETTPCTVTLIDDEMDARQLRRWLRAQGIKNTDNVRIVPLRGSVASFNILDPQIRARWANALRGTEVLIFDCLRPVLDALGLDEHRDAGRFLVAFDALLKEAGIGEAIVVHHMGHNGERSRGDSRLRDWPDVEWRLVRNGDEPNAPRFFSAFGRDVDVPETALKYDPETRRLTLGTGNRGDVKVNAALAEILALLNDHEPMSGRKIEEALRESEHTQKAVRDALKVGIGSGEIVTSEGPRHSILHSSASVRRSALQVRQRVEGECVSASIDNAHALTADNESSALPICSCGNVAEAESNTCWRCAA